MPLAKPNLGTIAARMPLRAVRFCGRRGHDEAALCARVGVSLDALSAPETRVPYETARSIADELIPAFRADMARPDEVAADIHPYDPI